MYIPGWWERIPWWVDSTRLVVPGFLKRKETSLRIREASILPKTDTHREAYGRVHPVHTHREAYTGLPTYKGRHIQGI